MAKKVKDSVAIFRLGFLDDEREQLKSLGNFFSPKEEFQSLYSTDPTEAIGWILKDKVDILISDLNLGQEEKDGIEILLKARSCNFEIPLILYSGYIVKPERKVVCAKNSIEIVRKMAGPNELIRKINLLFGIDREELSYDIGSNLVVSEGGDSKRLVFIFAERLIKDLEQLRSDVPEFKILAGDQVFTPEQMLNEINSLSPIGVNFLENYFRGVNISKEIKSKQK